MFLQLLITTFLLSAVDSLNPFVLSQQFVLQGLIKKPAHIWYFIAAVSITNLLIGLLAYMGFAAFLPSIIDKIVGEFAHILRIALLTSGAVLMLLSLLLITKNLIKRRHKKAASNCQSDNAKANCQYDNGASNCQSGNAKANCQYDNGASNCQSGNGASNCQRAERALPAAPLKLNCGTPPCGPTPGSHENSRLNGTLSGSDEQKARAKVRSVTPAALFALGIVTTLAELLTALPYFTYITVTVAANYPHIQALPALLFYNIIYVLPNVVLCVVYIKAHAKFEALYTALKRIMASLAPVAMPALMFTAGILLVVYS